MSVFSGINPQIHHYLRLFSQLPVRRLSHPSAQKTMELVRRDIERYGLMSPHVSFTLERSTKGKDGQSDQTRVLTVVKARSCGMPRSGAQNLSTPILDCFLFGCFPWHLWQKSCGSEALCQGSVPQLLIVGLKHVDELSVKRGDLLVEGFISLRGAPSKVSSFRCSDSALGRLSFIPTFNRITLRHINSFVSLSGFP